LKLTEG